MDANNSGDDNTVMGALAMTNNVTGYQNVAVGQGSLYE